MEIISILLIELGILFWSFVVYFKRNDEILLLMNSFIAYSFFYRYFVIHIEVTDWLPFVGHVEYKELISSFLIIIFAQALFLLVYSCTRRKAIPLIPAEKFRNFFPQKYFRVIVFSGFLVLPIVLFTRYQLSLLVDQGQSLAFDITGYIYLFPMVLVGISVLCLWLWRFSGVNKLGYKILILILLGFSWSMTFGPKARFQFLGWLLAGVTILLCNTGIKKKTFFLAGFLAGILVLFGIAGAMRGISRGTSEGSFSDGLERVLIAEDANMLDGFIMMKRAVPKYFDYKYGMEHFEILLRPIPRAIWKGKPASASYLDFYGLINRKQGTKVGFSPSLFGSFYIEGGVIGVFLFSFLYAFLIAQIINYSIRITPHFGLLIRAILYASFIPLLRGGDLPGIYAWIGMAFWPCFLLLWLNRKKISLRNLD